MEVSQQQLKIAWHRSSKGARLHIFCLTQQSLPKLSNVRAQTEARSEVKGVSWHRGCAR